MSNEEPAQQQLQEHLQRQGQVQQGSGREDDGTLHPRGHQDDDSAHGGQQGVVQEPDAATGRLWRFLEGTRTRTEPHERGAHQGVRHRSLRLPDARQ